MVSNDVCVFPQVRSPGCSIYFAANICTVLVFSGPKNIWQFFLSFFFWVEIVQVTIILIFACNEHCHSQNNHIHNSVMRKQKLFHVIICIINIAMEIIMQCSSAFMVSCFSTVITVSWKNLHVIIMKPKRWVVFKECFPHV